MKKLLTGMVIFVAAVSMSAAATFYIDPNTGNDSGDGSENNPWQSITKTLDLGAGTQGRAKAAAGEEITYILADGHYGSLQLTGTEGMAKAAPSVWTTYKAAPGAKAVFHSMDFSFSTLTDLKMKFVGLTIDPSRPMPGTRAKAAALNPVGAVWLSGVSNVTYSECLITKGSRYDGGYAAYMENCKNILIEKSEITEAARCVQYTNCDGVTIKWCHVHGTTNSAISHQYTNKNCLIEGNHIHDQVSYEGSHASAISMRSGEITIRGNIVHDGYSSSGFMTYDTEKQGQNIIYNNVVIENNLLYNITNVYLLRFYQAGAGIVIRNNTLVGTERDKTGEYHFTTALLVHNTRAGFSMSVYNNIMVGIVSWPGGTQAGGNYMWSYMQNGDWTCTAPGTNNKVVTCSSAEPTTFHIGFFVNPNLAANAGNEDYHLADNSPGINFGLAAHQTSRGLGTIGPDGFLMDNGPTRDAGHHCAGAYEYGGVITAQAPVISPNGGTFTGSAQVTLSSATAGADIHYTTGGATPTSGSTKYTAPFLMTSSGTVKAIAIKTGYENSPVTSATFTINQDTAPPTVTSVTARFNNTSVAVTFSEALNKTTAENKANYSINGITVNAASLSGDLKTVTLTTSTLSEGVIYTLTVNNVADPSGNKVAANTQKQFSYVNTDLSNGLVAYYDFEGTGSTVIDRAGSNNGTLTGAVRTTGISGQAPQFAGSGYVQVSNSSSLEFGSGDFTVSAWFKSSDKVDIWESGAGSGSAAYIWIRMNKTVASNMNIFRVDDGNEKAEIVLNTSGAFDNQWHHIVCKRDGSKLYAYLDNVQIGSADATGRGSISNSKPNYFGKSTYDNKDDSNSNGAIDEVRLYNRALAVTEIGALYGNPASNVTSLPPGYVVPEKLADIPNPVNIKTIEDLRLKIEDLRFYSTAGRVITRARKMVPGIYYFQYGSILGRIVVVK